MVNLMKQYRLEKIKSFKNLVKNTGGATLVEWHLVKMHAQRQVKQKMQRKGLL